MENAKKFLCDVAKGELATIAVAYRARSEAEAEVLAALWRKFKRATNLFEVAYYDEWNGGRGIAEAKHTGVQDPQRSTENERKCMHNPQYCDCFVSASPSLGYKGTKAFYGKSRPFGQHDPLDPGYGHGCLTLVYSGDRVNEVMAVITASDFAPGHLGAQVGRHFGHGENIQGCGVSHKLLGGPWDEVRRLLAEQRFTPQSPERRQEDAEILTRMKREDEERRSRRW